MLYKHQQDFPGTLVITNILLNFSQHNATLNLN